MSREPVPLRKEQQTREKRWGKLLQALSEVQKSKFTPWASEHELKCLSKEDLKCEVALVQPHLYIGSEAVAHHAVLLQHLGITHIVSVMNWTGLPQHDKIQYLRFPIIDRPSAPIHRFFVHASKWISRAQTVHKGTVLVHCQAGISRSATIVIAHLMRLQGLSYVNAESIVKQARPLIHPNYGFVKQLQTFGLQLSNNAKHRQRKELIRFLLAAIVPNPQNRSNCRLRKCLLLIAQFCI